MLLPLIPCIIIFNVYLIDIGKVLIDNSHIIDNSDITYENEKL